MKTKHHIEKTPRASREYEKVPM